MLLPKKLTLEQLFKFSSFKMDAEVIIAFTFANFDIYYLSSIMSLDNLFFLNCRYYTQCYTNQLSKAVQPILAGKQLHSLVLAKTCLRDQLVRENNI